MDKATLKLMSAGALAVGLLSFGAAAQQAEAAGLAIGNWEDGVTVAAASPWTAADMLAAKPYPMPKGGATVTDTEAADATLDVSGPPVFASGALPGGEGKTPPAMLAKDAVAPALGPIAQGYSYPGPFTRFHVGNIASYTTYPFRTIGKLFFKQYGTSYVCSASVMGNKGIVTAGHCLHAGNGLSTGWSTNVVFVPAYKNGAAPYGQWPIYSLRTFTDWYNNGASGDFDHDWGAGRTSYTRNGRTIGQTVGYLGYTYNLSRNQMWWEIGYPASSPFNGMYMYACNASYAYNSPFYSGGPAPMSVGCDMTGGCSGGPWIKNFGNGTAVYVNGVNSHRATARPAELSSPYANTDTYNAIYSWIRLP